MNDPVAVGPLPVDYFIIKLPDQPDRLVMRLAPLTYAVQSSRYSNQFHVCRLSNPPLRWRNCEPVNSEECCWPFTTSSHQTCPHVEAAEAAHEVYLAIRERGCCVNCGAETITDPCELCGQPKPRQPVPLRKE